ncbi:MAG: trehalose-6-phosphate synthase, partial [Chloroflexi bacterium]|nr:trehalose-6-phosphate synthase [Chloroflexota bacterium]
AERGRGGVVTALSAINQFVPLTWIAAAMSEGDRRAARSAESGRIRSPLPGQKLQLRFVVSPKAVYYKYYNVFCNPLIWFLQHYMWNSPTTPNINESTYDAWENGYIAVNHAFAQAVIAEGVESEVPPFVMLHDYHLYLAAGEIRAHLPRAILQHFTHIPWPAPAYWQLLPSIMARSICENLCANDIVGMQTIASVRNFLHTCQNYLEDAEVDYRLGTVWRDGHLTTVKAYPISIDVEGLRRMVNSSAAQNYLRDLRSLCAEKTVVRVDRMEPSKNIIRGFRAFDTLLERYPEYRGKVKFLAFLVPSRTDVRQYQRYSDDVSNLIEAINGKYGDDSWQPIKVFYENNYPQAIAGMRLADVLLVNPVIDGMNLVAKEGPISNSRDLVLILSEAAGAFDQLKEGVLPVAPADIEGTARALRSALEMEPEERKTRLDFLRKCVEEEDLTMWLYHQLEDLSKLA